MKQSTVCSPTYITDVVYVTNFKMILKIVVMEWTKVYCKSAKVYKLWFVNRPVNDFKLWLGIQLLVLIYLE